MAQVAKLLIKHGALIGAVDEQGRTPEDMWQGQQGMTWTEMTEELWGEAEDSKAAGGFYSNS